MAQCYKTISAKKAFEIVFISMDGSDVDFRSNFEDMPWLALRFSENEFQAYLSDKYERGIPSLVLIDGESGEVISRDGVSVIAGDQTGKQFPWTHLKEATRNMRKKE